jgi:hypothetical protein
VEVPAVCELVSASKPLDRLFLYEKLPLEVVEKSLFSAILTHIIKLKLGATLKNTKIVFPQIRTS